MSNWSVLGATGAALVLLFSLQPELVSMNVSSSYRTGEKVSSEIFLLDDRGESQKLLDLLDEEARVVVIIFFGGGFAEKPKVDFRGPLWCVDSFDDLAVQRAVMARFEHDPVQFIGVAVPPVYHTEMYGYPKDVFLSRHFRSAEYREAVDQFIQKTLEAQETTLLPYSDLYFDPRFRLLLSSGGRQMPSEYGRVYDWQGMFKWHEDSRLYGTPTIWLLDSEGRVLREPFTGNEYDHVPPRITYQFEELEEAVREALQR